MKLQTEKAFYGLYLFAVLALLSGFVSCSNEKLNISGEGGDNVLILNYQVDGGVEGQTYALASEPHECQIDEVYALFFRASDHATEPNKYVGYSRMGVSSTTSSGTPQINMPAGEHANDKWQLIFLANFDRNAFLDGETSVKNLLAHKVSGLTFDEARKYLSAYFDRASGLVAPFPMSVSAVKETSNNAVSGLTFTRRVARIDVHNSAPGFVLETVQVWNARTGGHLFDEGGNSLSTNSETDFRNYSDYTVIASGGVIEAQLYVFPNFVVLPTDRDHVTTCLIIGGKYNGSNTTTYYRVNVSAPGRQQNLKANYVYTLNITSISGSGEGNPGDAYEKLSRGFCFYYLKE